MPTFDREKVNNGCSLLLHTVVLAMIKVNTIGLFGQLLQYDLW
ncbi:hypothetical protein SAMN05216323_102230 [Williamwhitmania taraxaci]|uniref:Uncharacterized protein n=1 Tax=Williamwhitmania taraxaci TaxID=1640674 RepID=A0A1G6JZD9_9BACT|nr:hypothetical protein SAMN05216323_102230 [Williamwhitmania taraxaci]